MPTLAAHLAEAPGSDLVGDMLRVVPERGSDIRVVRSGRFVLGVAGDERLPDEASLEEDGGWAAVVVGTVDEVSRGVAFASPAAAVLDTVRSGGPEALDRLRGAFAAVVTDGGRVWAARDHVGTEPLYYHASPGRLLLVSEPKQLEAVPDVELRPDLEVVEAIFYGEEYEPRRSVYRDVRRVEMASYLEWSGSGARLRRYWHPERLFESARLGPGEIAERFHALMSRAVRRTLRGKDAVLLSGGIDSPAVAAYVDGGAGGEGHGRVGAVSAVYPQHPSVDERDLIEMLASEYGLELHTYTPGPLTLGRLAEWVRTFDGPWAAWHPGWAEQTYRFAAERGYTGLLTGFFAENVADLQRGLPQHLLATGRFRDALAHLHDRGGRGDTAAAVLRPLLSPFVPGWAMSLYRRFRPRGAIPPWMDAGRLGRRDADQAVPPRRLWKTAQLGFLSGPHPAMEAYAKLQARCGVRVRHPWADVDLWEFFLSLPAQVKHPDARSKGLVRDLLRGRVPDAILDRRKVVFNAYITDEIDYPSLRRWLKDPSVRLAGIDYEVLAERLDGERLSMAEYMSAKDLATAHAFLAEW